MKIHPLIVFAFAAGLAGIAFGQASAPAQKKTTPQAAPKTAVPAKATAVQLKIGIVRTRGLILNSIDGKKAVTALNADMDGRKKELEKRKNDITNLQLRLNLAKDRMSQTEQDDLTRRIDQQTRDQNRLVDDMQADYEQKQNAIFQQLGDKLAAVVRDYARANGYTAIVDANGPSVVFASPALDITPQIAALYDKAASALPGVPAPTKPAATPPATKK